MTWALVQSDGRLLSAIGGVPSRRMLFVLPYAGSRLASGAKGAKTRIPCANSVLAPFTPRPYARASPAGARALNRPSLTQDDAACGQVVCVAERGGVAPATSPVTGT